jgi:FKBP-type peptidyl-prolyl cis-trans isomerase SlyD
MPPGRHWRSGMSKRRNGEKNGAARPRGFQLGPGVWTRLRYRVFDAEGELVEGSGGELGFVFGYGTLLPALESALEGLAAGAKRTVELSARDAYGERKTELEMEIAREDFPPDVAAGDRFELEREDGTEVVVRVLGVSDDGVVVDFNHPLAGQRIRFEIEVLEARAGTPEELEIAESALLQPADGESETLIPVTDLIRRLPS